MRGVMRFALGFVFLSAPGWAQTTEELVAKNIEARGGMERIKAINTLRKHGKMQQGSFVAWVRMDSMAPDMLRQSFTIRGQTQVQGYDGSIGWEISSFKGHKDPQILGENDARDLVDQSDFYGPLVDYKTKGNKVEFLGHATIDGNDTLRLKVTLKNGDIITCYLNSITYLEIRMELTEFIRGAVKESRTTLGSYSQVAGVYFPFSMEVALKNDPQASTKIVFDKIEANVELDRSEFQMPQIGTK